MLQVPPDSPELPNAFQALNVLDSISDAVAELDSQFRFTYANASCVRLLRVPRGKLIGACFWDLLPDLAGTEAEREMRRGMQLQVRASFEYWYPRIDLWVDVNLYPASGGLVAVVRDITPRKRAAQEREKYQAALILAQREAQERIEQQRARLRLVTDNLPALVAYIDRDCRYQFVNHRYSEWFLRPVSEIEGRTVLEALGEEMWRKIEPQFRRALNGEILSYEMPNNYPIGTFWVRPTYIPDIDASGRVCGVVALIQDITEAHRAEEALRKSEEQYRFLANAMPQLVWVAGSDGKTEFLNDYWYEYTGATREEGVMAWERVVPAEDSAAMAAAWEKASRSAVPFDMEWRLRRHSDGALRWHLARAKPILDAEGQVLKWIGTALDIHDRKNAELELSRARRDQEDILESITDSFIALDREWRFVYVNKRVAEKLGMRREDLIGQNVWELAPDAAKPLFYPKFQQVMNERIPVQFEMPYPPDRWLHVYAHPTETGMTAYIADRTEQKRAEEALRQKAKLESIGLVAGGVAHDFNNLLVGILGAASLIKETLRKDAPEYEMFRLISNSAQRAADLTRQMLTYAGKSKADKQPVDLNRTINDTVQLLRSTIPHTTHVTVDLSPRVPFFAGDPGQIQQVVLNLLTNASEAIPKELPGKITIRTTVHHEPAGRTVGVETLPPADYVELLVTDTGEGMTPDVIDRIFDPFFTTKFTGRGLGLAAVQGIVRNHEGAIDVESVPGKGTTFRVFLKLAETSPQPAKTAGTGFRRGYGTVLVIDDESAVRDTCEQMLTRHGYRVVVAPDGRAGIEKFRKHRDELSALVIDLTMPDQSGFDVLRALDSEIANLRVILSTGHSRHDFHKEMERFPSVAILQKPYGVDELINALQKK